MSFSCRLIEDHNHNNIHSRLEDNNDDIEDQESQDRYGNRPCLSDYDSWDDDDDHHQDDDDDEECPEDETDPKRFSSSSLLPHFLQDPIVIGYAFGPKKMSTMGVVMAEASKAKVTTTTPTTTKPLPPPPTPAAAVSMAVVSTTTVPTLSSSSSSSTCRLTPPAVVEEEKPTMMTTTTSKNDNRDGKEISSESSSWSSSGTTEANTVSDAAAAVATSSIPGTGTANTTSTNTTGTLLTWDALHSMMEPTTRTIFSIGGGNNNINQEYDGNTSTTTANTTATSNNLKHIVRYFQSSCSSVASGTETTVSTKTTISAKTSSWTAGGGGSSSRSTQQQNQQSATTPYHQYPVRLSFVPLDPNLSLEEQQGGKLDLILHKLTEDILECSLLTETAATTTSTTTATQQDNNKNNESFQRIARLKKYQYDHPECCMVDDPRHVQTLMSRSEIGYVLQQCLQDVTSTSGIPVCAPKFVECRLPPRQLSAVSPPAAPLTPLRSTSNQQVDDTATSKLVHTVKDRLQEAHMYSFPLIAKPLIAAGTKQSHSMAVLLNPEALPLFLQHKAEQQQQQQQHHDQHQHPHAQQQQQQQQHNLVLQEYVNHNAVLYKVYVLGDTVKVYQRPSLPNLPKSQMHHHHQVKNGDDSTRTVTPENSDGHLVPNKEEKGLFVEFDSQRPYPRLQDFGIEGAPSSTTPSGTNATSTTLTATRAGTTTTTTTPPPPPFTKTKAFTPGGSASTPVAATATTVTESEVRPIVNALKRAFGLELFGFDILLTAKEEKKKVGPTTSSCPIIAKTNIDKNGQEEEQNKNGRHDDDDVDTSVRMLVVDVNYFPSYKEVPNFPFLLAHYLTQRVLQSREQQEVQKQQQEQQQNQKGD